MTIAKFAQQAEKTLRKYIGHNAYESILPRRIIWYHPPALIKRINILRKVDHPGTPAAFEGHEAAAIH
jgi:hypothetical protein